MPAAMPSPLPSHLPQISDGYPNSSKGTRLRRPLKRPPKVTSHAREKDPNGDPVDCCPPYTEAFNNLLKQVKHGDGAVAAQIARRMREKSVVMTLQTYHLLLDIMADSDSDAFFQMYEDMREAALREDVGSVPDAQTFTIVLRACERYGAYAKAFQIFHDMKVDFGMQPDVTMYNSLIGFCAAVRDERTASEVFEEMKEKGIRPNVYTYNTLMNVFSGAPYKVIQQMFDDMPVRGIQPNIRSYNTIMNACKRANDFQGAFKFFTQLKAKGLIPTVVTYNTLLECCVAQLPTNSSEEDAQGTDILVTSLVTTSLELLNEMSSVGEVPNLATYNAVMTVLAHAGDARVFEMFDDVLAKQREAEAAVDEEVAAAAFTEILEEEAMDCSFTADSQMVKKKVTLADFLDDRPPADVPSGRFTASRQSSKVMEDNGLRPDLQMYNVIIMACVKMGLIAKAWENFHMMITVGVKPNKNTYIHMLAACCAQGDKKGARELLEEARASQIPLDADLYNSFLNVLAEAQDDDVLETYAEMRALDVPPNQTTYNTLLVACQRKNNAKQAIKLYVEMLEDTSTRPSAKTFGILMEICGSTRETAWARALLHDMVEYGVPVTTAMVNRCIKALIQADDANGAMSLLRLLRTQGPEPNLETYTVLLTYYRDKMQSAENGTQSTMGDTILQLFTEMKDSGVILDLNTYNILLDYCACVRDKRMALKFFEELKLCGLVADVNTYNALMSVFAESGDPLIYKILEEMNENAIPPNPLTFSILIKHKKGLECLRTAAQQRLLLPHFNQ